MVHETHDDVIEVQAEMHCSKKGSFNILTFERLNYLESTIDFV